MANWSLPSLSNNYSDFLTYIKALANDGATAFVGAVSNQPTGAMKWERTNDLWQEWSGSAWVDQILSIAGGGTGASTAGGARTNLGLGTISTQNANGVNITGGSITGITDITVADGGTGASTEAGARTNLGLGTISTQNANAVSISGGTLSGLTGLAMAASQTFNMTANGTVGAVSLLQNGAAITYETVGGDHAHVWKTNGTNRAQLTSAGLCPTSDLGLQLGTGSLRWDECHADEVYAGKLFSGLLNNGESEIHLSDGGDASIRHYAGIDLSGEHYFYTGGLITSTLLFSIRNTGKISFDSLGTVTYTLPTFTTDRSLSSSPSTTELRDVVATLISDLDYRGIFDG